MKALVKREAREGIWLEDVPEPDVGINDVLMKVKRTAICACQPATKHCVKLRWQ